MQSKRSQVALLESCREDIAPPGKADSSEFRDTLLGEVVLEASVVIAETLKEAVAAVLSRGLKTGLEGLAHSAKEALVEGYRLYLSQGVYTPDLTDALDVQVARTVNAARSDAVVPLFRLSQGTYLFGTAHITITADSGALQVHSASQVQSLAQYLAVYAPVEQQKVAAALNL